MIALPLGNINYRHAKLKRTHTESNWYHSFINDDFTNGHNLDY